MCASRVERDRVGKRCPNWMMSGLQSQPDLLDFLRIGAVQEEVLHRGEVEPEIQPRVGPREWTAPTAAYRWELDRRAPPRERHMWRGTSLKLWYRILGLARARPPQELAQWKSLARERIGVLQWPSRPSWYVSGAWVKPQGLEWPSSSSRTTYLSGTPVLKCLGYECNGGFH